MIGLQLLISKYGAASGHTDRGLKGIANTNILPPVQKSGEFEKSSLQVSKDFNKISPCFEVLLKSAEYALIGCSMEENKAWEVMAENGSSRSTFIDFHLMDKSLSNSGLMT
jgi:hypothetical protein